MTIPDTDRSHTYRDAYTAEQFKAEQSNPFGKYREAVITALSDKQFASALEVGCAIGTLIGRIHYHRACKCAGFDFSEAAIAVAKRQHPSVDFRVLDAEDMLTAYEPMQFDLILTSAVLQHCGAALFWKVCENIAALKPKHILHLEAHGDEKRVRANNEKLYCRHNYRAAYEALGLPAENIQVKPASGMTLITVTM